MPSPPPHCPLALSPLPLPAFLTYILRRHRAPTTLIICSSREAFLQELRASIAVVVDNSTHHHHARDAHSSGGGDDDDDDGHSSPSSSLSSSDNNSNAIHPLSTPTIHLISQSQSITLAFAPTLPHLRAYIATYPNSAVPTSRSRSTKPGGRGAQYPILAIWGLATLHRSTAEHSAQGLSRSLAAAVETAKVNGQRLVLAEAAALDEDEDGEDGGMSGGGDPWREQVPLLSGSVRFGGEDRVWAGRTVEVKRVVGRWCRFVTIGDGG